MSIRNDERRSSPRGQPSAGISRREGVLSGIAIALLLFLGGLIFYSNASIQSRAAEAKINADFAELNRHALVAPARVASLPAQSVIQ
jgi:hypothetical protein